VTTDGESVALTRTEFDLLRLLLSHRCQVFSRQELLDRVWPKDVIVTNRTVDVNITRMRKKIGRYGQCVVARQGFGYVFEERRSKE
jgi:DNA-binding response OmpR family regulator